MTDMARQYEHVVREKTRHGKIVWYFRRGHEKRIRLPDEYGSTAFEAAYEAALYGLPKPVITKSKAAHGSLRWLVDRYMETADWANSAPSTKSTKAAILKHILAQSGDVQIHRLTPQAIRDGRNRRADTPDAANRFIKTLSPIFKFAVEAGFMDSNPCTGVAKLKIKSTGGFVPWTVEDIDAFADYHAVGTNARLAFDLLRFTGLRRSDVVTLGRQHERNGEFRLRTQKTNTLVELPIIPDLRYTLDNSPTGDLTYLVTAYGKPFTNAGFGGWFKARCVEAGVIGDKKNAHGIRKHAAMTLAENGATGSMLLAVFGWSTLKQADTYIQAANRRKMAGDAMNKLRTNIPHLVK
tara:strand:- start:1058 stop:2113 length:1056 start_codon:yes stop_codon:yes gene_type:complete